MVLLGGPGEGGMTNTPVFMFVVSVYGKSDGFDEIKAKNKNFTL